MQLESQATMTAQQALLAPPQATPGSGPTPILVPIKKVSSALLSRVVIWECPLTFYKFFTHPMLSSAFPAKAKFLGVMTTGLASAFALASAPAHALVFQFQFDDVFDGLPLDLPIVGSGSFSFDGDPGVGSFALTSLPNYTFSFLFDDGNSFGNADIATPLSEVLVLISQTGNTYGLKFSNTDPSGFGGGLFGGSIDFFNTVSA